MLDLSGFWEGLDTSGFGVQGLKGFRSSDSGSGLCGFRL